MSRKSRLAKHRTKDSGAHDEVTHQVIQVVRQEVRQELRHFSGPLPPPDELAKYERVQPGYAKAILEMATKSQDHAHAMDLKTLDFQKESVERHQNLFGRGQFIGASLGFSGIVGGTLIAIFADATVGGSVIGGVVALLGGAFAWGKWHDSKKSESDEPPSESDSTSLSENNND